MKACKPFSTKATSFHLGAEMVQVGYCRRVWRRISFSTCTDGALRRLKLRSLANARTDFPFSLLFTYLSLFRANWNPVKSSGSNREKPASILGFSSIAGSLRIYFIFIPVFCPVTGKDRFAIRKLWRFHQPNLRCRPANFSCPLRNWTQTLTGRKLGGRNAEPG